MKYITTGTEIIFNFSTGRLVKYCEELSSFIPSNSIVFSEKLTNNLAVNALKSNVNGIITRTTSFSAHGANILRGSNNGIVWVTNVDIDLLHQYEGAYVAIDMKGSIYLFSETDSINMNQLVKQDDDIRYNYISPPLNDTSIIEYNLTTGEFWICYWERNYFSNYIFSSLSKGIKNEFNRLFGFTPNVKRTTDGKVWVNTNITHSYLIEYCCNPKQLINYTKTALHIYNYILSLLRDNILTIGLLQDCLIHYYSTFTLIHRSYEYTLYKLYETMVSEQNGYLAVSYMNCLLNCKIDNWIVEQSNHINNSKVFMEPEGLVPIPSFTIEDDIQESIQNTERFVTKNDINEFYNRHYLRIHSAIQLFVIKEWKFVIYKLLTSRCFYFFSHCTNLDLSTVAESSYLELEGKFGNKKVIIPCKQ